MAGLKPLLKERGPAAWNFNFMEKEQNQDNKIAPSANQSGDLNKTEKAVSQTASEERGRRMRGVRRGFGRKREESTDEFEQRVLDVARVTRVMAGGKRMRFRACVAVGNKKGKIAVGLDKGADVTMAVSKAVNEAKKNMLEVPLTRETIPHEVCVKFGAAKVLLKPAGKGRGVIAGGVVRIILELAGVRNVTSKILGSNNKVNNARCVIKALKSLKKVEDKTAVK